jgi:hypothetical protein
MGTSSIGFCSGGTNIVYYWGSFPHRWNPPSDEVLMRGVCWAPRWVSRAVRASTCLYVQDVDISSVLIPGNTSCSGHELIYHPP